MKGLFLVSSPKKIGFDAPVFSKTTKSPTLEDTNSPEQLSQLWSDAFCAHYSSAQCALCRHAGISTGKLSEDNPCRCVLRAVARQGAAYLRAKRESVVNFSSTLTPGRDAGDSRNFEKLGADRTRQQSEWGDHMNYCVDFSLILDTLHQESRDIYELHCVQALPWEEVATRLFIRTKNGFFNELYRVENIVGRLLVERGLFPSFRYIHTKAVRAVALAAQGELPYTPVRAPLKPAVRLVRTKVNKAPRFKLQCAA